MFLLRTILVHIGAVALTSIHGCLAQNSTTYDPINQPIFQLSSDAEQAFFLEEVLSLANNGGANTGEVLRIATQIVPGNEESTYSAFYPFAESIYELAESIDPLVDPVGARENYFHASTYYRAAAFLLIGNQSDPRLVSLWNQELASFDKAIALLEPAPGERFTVKATNSSIGPFDIPGYFFKGNANPHKKLPTFVMVGGYDASQQESYHGLCEEVLRRGMNCVTYEGPGQPSPRRFQNIGFIPDWWTATTPVVDFLFTRQDVDTTKLVLLGESFGGTLAPLAASQDHRFSALIALDGLASLQQSLIPQFPASLVALYDNGLIKEFDKVVISVATNVSLPINIRWIFQQGLYAFKTTSPFDWFKRLGEINLTPAIVAGLGSLPVYVAKGEDDTLTGDQANLAFDMLVANRPDGKNLTYFHEFKTNLGAGEHCSIGAETQVWSDIIRWLSGVWDGYKFNCNT